MIATRHRTVLSALLLGLLLGPMACIERMGGVGPSVQAELDLRLLPQIDPALANTEASLRLVEMEFEIRDAETLEILEEGLVNLDGQQPDSEPAAEVQLLVDVGTSIDVRGQIRLLGEDGRIEWSGFFDPFPVSDNREVWEIEVPVGRGDLTNLTVSEITLEGPGQPLVVGGTATLTPVVQGGPDNPQVFWGSQDPSIVTVDDAGVVTGVAPGDGTITVSAGMHVATTVVSVTEGEAARAVASPEGDVRIRP